MVPATSLPQKASVVVDDLFVVGPHNGAHRVALRAGLSVAVPLLLCVVTGHVRWSAFAAFGAFTSLYGRANTHAERLAMQASAACVLVGSVMAGLLVGLAPGTRWLIVLAGAVLACLASVVSDIFRWHPPGPLFPVFGLCVCASIPPSPANLLPAFLVASGSALFSMAVGYLGIFRQAGADLLVAPVRRSAWVVLGNAEQRRHLIRSFVAVTASGAIGTLMGGSHPYWAMVAAVAGISGRSMRARVTRAVHRLVGTLAGVAVAAPFLFMYPRGVWAVALIVLFQIGAELLVGRNYMLALLCVTPLALLMGQLAQEMPAWSIIVDRALETCIGAGVALVALFLVRDPRNRPMDKD